MNAATKSKMEAGRPITSTENRKWNIYLFSDLNIVYGLIVLQAKLKMKRRK